eukprot:gnl/TRDRNA2_/TRDRNA2_41330_c0_seq1.p1 gnl/TRDRNA2_/TRDRNA2_41330_c0~~gnl/TRDRNA2_/TRDRNA2_41330_c0_seq1.p1  ORF type:complete len:386 (-),score=75.52 gnl/TRDRNA2_/TRDRNA2_41330_c0_seq1:16-1116(-)
MLSAALLSKRCAARAAPLLRITAAKPSLSVAGVAPASGVFARFCSGNSAAGCTAATQPPSWREDGRGLAAAVLGAVALAGGAQAAANPPARCEEKKQAAAPAATGPTLGQKCLAEAIGTGLIVHGGCGIVCTGKYAGVNLMPAHMSIVWGATVALAVYATRDISGAHLNPAVTAALAVNKPEACPKSEVVPYISAQIAGATIAGMINYIIFQAGIAALEAKEGIVRGNVGSGSLYAGAFGMLPNTQLMPGLAPVVAEIWMTAVLLFMIFAITDPDSTVPADAGPALVGTTVAILVAMYGGLTGCGMNPARDIGPRIAAAIGGWGTVAFESAWIYTVGPIIGGIIGGALYMATMAKPKTAAKLADAA